MSKNILLDIDGVVILRHKYFSEKFSEEYGIPNEKIMPFFKGDYKKAAIGKVDIRDVLLSYLKKWSWTRSVDDFLNYWYESERDVDERVVKIVKELREKGTKVYLVSDNEAGRAKYLMEKVGLGDEFDGGFFSSDLGVTKSNPQFFEKVIEKLEVQPEEIDYWDDDLKNVEVAKGVGIKGHTYTEFEKFKSKV